MLNKEEHDALRSALESLLAGEGFRPRRTENDDIVFKLEGRSCYLDFDAEDPCYVRLLQPGFWSVDDAPELRTAYVAANEVSARCKGVKVCVVDEESAWASVEFLVPSAKFISAEMLDRQIQMIQVGIREFVDRMRELKAVEDECAPAKTRH